MYLARASRAHHNHDYDYLRRHFPLAAPGAGETPESSQSSLEGCEHTQVLKIVLGAVVLTNSIKQSAARGEARVSINH